MPLDEERRPDLAVRDGAEQLNFWPTNDTRPPRPTQISGDDLAAAEPLVWRAMNADAAPPPSEAMGRAHRVVRDMRGRGVPDYRIAQALRLAHAHAREFGLVMPSWDFTPAWRRT